MSKNHFVDEDFFLVTPAWEDEIPEENHPALKELERVNEEYRNTSWLPMLEFFNYDVSFVTNQRGLDWISAKLPKFPLEISLATRKEVLEWQVEDLFFAPQPYKPSLPYLKKLVDH